MTQKLKLKKQLGRSGKLYHHKLIEQTAYSDYTCDERVTPEVVEQVIENYFKCFKEAVSSGYEVVVAGIGTFTPSYRRRSKIIEGQSAFVPMLKLRCIDQELYDDMIELIEEKERLRNEQSN